jgi:hypothetical protein
VVIGSKGPAIRFISLRSVPATGLNYLGKPFYPKSDSSAAFGFTL